MWTVWCKVLRNPGCTAKFGEARIRPPAPKVRASSAISNPCSDRGDAARPLGGLPGRAPSGSCGCSIMQSKPHFNPKTPQTLIDGAFRHNRSISCSCACSCKRSHGNLRLQAAQMLANAAHLLQTLRSSRALCGQELLRKQLCSQFRMGKWCKVTVEHRRAALGAL